MVDAEPPAGPGEEPDEQRRLDTERRRLFWTLPSGLYLIGSMAEGRRNLMTANWVTQVASEPKMIGVGIEVHALTHELIEASGRFTLSVIERAHRSVVRRFVKPATDDRAQMTLAGELYRDSAAFGLPVLDAALGYFECSLDQAVRYRSHSFFVAEVTNVVLGAALAEGGSVEVLAMADTRMNYGG